ncbi:MAG: carboxyltransferase domain-containing protein, partial [Burkholderiales bacterium]|nr:carboxyltransferase domain-containing protein [Burkholderiales bacterium]
MGDRALVLEVGDQIDGATVARVRALADHLMKKNWPGVFDVVPALHTIGIHYDPEQWRDGSGARTPYQVLVERIQKALPDLAPLEAVQGPLRKIEVCYEPEFGED